MIEIDDACPQVRLIVAFQSAKASLLFCDQILDAAVAGVSGVQSAKASLLFCGKESKLGSIDWVIRFQSAKARLLFCGKDRN